MNPEIAGAAPAQGVAPGGDITATGSWRRLQALAPHFLTRFDLRTAFAQDPQRFDQLSLRAPHLLADLSKNLWDESVLHALLALAEASGLPQRRALLLGGGIVNDTEQRPAGHAALRRAFLAGGATRSEDCAALGHMLAAAEEIRADARIHDVVHIGIGGSSLGPELAAQALRPYQTTRQRLHFVSNLDGHDLCEVLQRCKPAHTLFVAASKSWSTLETLNNAQSARAWLAAAGQDPAQHLIAITARPPVARAAGYTRVLAMPEDIGGRFSLWSAVGLPLAVALGAAGFRELLRGATEMDAHFERAPLARNLPVWLGLLDVWYSSLLQFPARCVIPYHHGLRRLPAYLQQLEMESNGKSVRRCGTPVGCDTSPMVWGEAGTNGQHAFFQWLHQGTQRTPVEFLLALRPAHTLAPEHHQLPLLANALAQAQALMIGAQAGPGQLPGHQDFPGNRPSTMLLLDDLSPASLGALLALHEHRVFVSGTVWGINSFDQWGVEIGKRLATDILRRLHTGETEGLDGSTSGLLQAARQAQGAKAELDDKRSAKDAKA